MGTKHGKVVVVGSCNTDMTLVCNELPGRGQTVLGGEVYTAGGGKGANQAVAAARAGARVSMVAALGNDDFGQLALNGLGGEKIDTHYTVIKKGRPSGVALILVEAVSGENQIAVATGANADLIPADVDRASAAIRNADLVLLQLEVPLPAVMRAAYLAKRAEVPVMLNPAPMPREPLPRELLSCVDILVPNQGELVRLAARASERMAAERLFGMGVKSLVVTQGARGATVITPEAVRPVPAFRVRAVDTVGAGDCFCGYLAAAMAEGCELHDAAVLASAAAAISVTRRGAQPGVPLRPEADRLARTAANRRERRR